MSARPRRMGVASLSLVVLAVACRQVVGIGDGPPIAPGECADAGLACSLGYRDPCGTCLDTSCSAYLTACWGDPTCQAVEQCLGPCQGDPACRASCLEAHPIGPNDLEDGLEACAAASGCAGSCGITCGGMAELFGTDSASGCQKCLLDNQSACSASQACAESEPCQDAVRCLQSGPNPDRFLACQLAHAGGSVDSLLMALDPCSVQCALGAQWSCVGQVRPVTNPGDTTVRLSFGNYFDSTSPTGMTVQVCNPVDVTCSSPTSSATTNDAGVVTVPIPGNVAGAATIGYLQLSGGGVVPELLYWGFPLSEPSWILGTYTATPANISSIEAALGIQPVPQRAGVIISVQDCSGTGSGAPGVRLSFETSPPSDAKTTQVIYNQSSLGTFAAEPAMTDLTGLAMILNVVPGTIKVTATPVGFDRPSTVVSAITRANTITGIYAVPNQGP